MDEGGSGKQLFFELAPEGPTRAADPFHSIDVATNGINGRVSPSVSPKLAYDTASTLGAAKGPARSRRSAESRHQEIPSIPQRAAIQWMLSEVSDAVLAASPVAAR